MRRRSSTARSGDDRLHRRSPRCLWGRADLPRPADRPIRLPRACRAATGSDTLVGADAAGCGTQARDRARVRRELRGLQRAQGLAADDAGRLSGCSLYGCSVNARNGLGRGSGASRCSRPSATRRRRARSITSIAGSTRQRRTCYGCQTSPASRPGRGSSTSPSSSIPTPGGSLAGEPAARHMPASSSMP